VQLRDGFRELIAMQDVIIRNAANRCRQLSQYVSEQPEVDVHVGLPSPPVGSSRHKLRNALSAFGAHRHRVEVAFLPYDADKKIKR
jgi:hypothetical protein